MVVILDFVEMDGALSCARVDAAERRNPALDISSKNDFPDSNHADVNG
jgi:hypothetical protein